MIRFNERSIEGKFIKAFLANTPVPFIDTVMLGDYVVVSFCYIYDREVVRCTRSGILGLTARYEPLYDFEFGTHYLLFSEIYKSNNDYYDYVTHQHLGDYLRHYRGVTGIDLMPFYNCFSNRFIDNIKFGNGEIYYHKFDGYKTAKIPIKFNRTYTIALDCASQVHLGAAFFDDDNILFTKPFDKSSEYSINQVLWKKPKALLTKPTCSYASPFTFKIENKDTSTEVALQTYQKNLYLLIQVPESNTSSITVLEGDYLHTKNKQIMNIARYSSINEIEQNKRMLSQLSLLQFNDRVSHPFARRLMEYLLQNVIDCEDEIPKNVYRLHQDLLNFYPLEDAKWDIWMDDTRWAIWKYQNNDAKTLRKIDLNGYLDKDTEYQMAKDIERLNK